MRDLRGRNALVTGASGGLGRHIARGLAREGMNVAVSGRREDALGSVVEELRGVGVTAAAVPADLSDPGQIEILAAGVEAALGQVDVLVNNAGIEVTAAFARCSAAELKEVVDVNLTAPMLLTQRVLPGMLARGRGHVVFISSTAGKFGPPFQQSYAAAKAGLVRLTQSLRIEYSSAPVGFSVVCPGFTVGGGMYERMREDGLESSRLIGETNADAVVAAALDAIRNDRPQLIESGAPIRPLLALAELAPRVPEWLGPRIGLTRLFGTAATRRARALRK